MWSMLSLLLHFVLALFCRWPDSTAQLQLPLDKLLGKTAEICISPACVDVFCVTSSGSFFFLQIPQVSPKLWISLQWKYKENGRRPLLLLTKELYRSLRLKSVLCPQCWDAKYLMTSALEQGLVVQRMWVGSSKQDHSLQGLQRLLMSLWRCHKILSSRNPKCRKRQWNYFGSCWMN